MAAITWNLLAFLFLLPLTNGLIHKLVIHNDERHIFEIETFGLIVGGKVEIDVTEFRLHGPWTHTVNSTHSNKDFDNNKELIDTISTRALASTKSSSVDTKSYYKTGFILRKADSESMAQQDLEEIRERNICIFEKQQPGDLIMDLTDQNKGHFLFEISNREAVGLYSLLFAQCNSPTTSRATAVSSSNNNKNLLVSFHLKAVFTNPGPNYLSAGEAPLPTLYLVFFVLFLIASLVWIWVLRAALHPTIANTGNVSNNTNNGKSEPRNVHRIHYLMLALILLKCLNLLVESIRYHYIALFGVSETWNIVYYIVATLKGIMLFTVIMLIGSGYSLMKNYLSDNEKRIISVVLALQVLDNVAMVFLEESAPGSQSWVTWRDILHLVDIMCCLAILIPIIWSIQHLRQAAEADGKAHNNLLKLTLFRQFYVMVVVYIYFTRIAVYLLTATVPFYLLWLGPLADEAATLLFYVFTGYKFQPAVDNPYLPVNSEDLEGAEYGLEDDDTDQVDIELVGSLRGKKNTAGLSLGQSK